MMPTQNNKRNDYVNTAWVAYYAVVIRREIYVINMKLTEPALETSQKKYGISRCMVIDIVPDKK